MKARATKLRLLFILVICLFLCIYALWVTTDGLCLKMYLPPNNSGLPGYISDIWPSPESELFAGCYALSLEKSVVMLNPRGMNLKGINLKIDSDAVSRLLMSRTKELIKEPFPQWVSLYIDGRQISNSLKEYGCSCSSALLQFNGKPYPFDLQIGGVYTFSWATPLTAGNHIAKVVVVIPNVEPLEYEWHFKIK